MIYHQLDRTCTIFHHSFMIVHQKLPQQRSPYLKTILHIYNVENVCLNSNYLNDLENLTFSGTDNGFVIMTEAVAFSLERFKHHLQMYQSSRNSKDEGSIYDYCHIKNSPYTDKSNII
jgi:hypothetical protein